MQFNNKYDKQMISIDVVIFSVIDNKFKILLAKRATTPYQNNWSLIGGGVYNDETCENAVIRELNQKLNIKKINPILSGVFSDPKRDERFRNISISYYCIINNDLPIVHNIEKILDIKWFDISEVPNNLAFDHNQIFNTALKQLREKIYDIDYIKHYLPKTFTLKSLQLIYESILQIKLDKRNFRRKLNSLNCLISTGEKNLLDLHKKSEIYTFK